MAPTVKSTKVPRFEAQMVIFFAFVAELQIRFQGFECETDAFNHL